MDAVFRKPLSSSDAHSIGRDPSQNVERHAVTFDAGSFRDRTSRVFVCENRVYRTLNSESLATWHRVSAEPFYRQLLAGGEVVESRELSADEIARFSPAPGVAGILEHERIPFISYPYEWCFSMLRQAALLHLQILSDAIRSGLILKDASPYNVQFRGKKRVFIDLGSFIGHSSHEPWVAYRQFCELMLFPLLLQAYRRVHFQPILRGQLEGIPAKQFLQWIRWRDLFRPGVFTNGWLQSKLEQQTQSLSTSTVRDLKISGFHESMIQQMLKKLTRLIEQLDWKPERTQWTNYDDTLPHVAEDRQFKSEFVRNVCRARQHNLVWDLGCNDGRYSVIAAEFATTVVAMDQDHACVDRLYKSDSPANILPLCMELVNASPGQGWRGRERKRIEERGRPDLVFCLGLIHHLVLAGNIPLPEVIDWLASFGGEVILEFPSKQDAMVRSLLRNKHDQYDDYSQERLELELSKYFQIRQKESLPSGERTLYHLIRDFSLTGAK